MLTTSSLVVVIFLASLISLSTMKMQVGNWKNCSIELPPSQSPPHLSPKLGYGFGCSAVNQNKKASEIYKTRRGIIHVMHYPYNRVEPICSKSWTDVSYEVDNNGTRVDTCAQYYCDPMPDNFIGYREYYTDAINYCLYCKNAPGREEFLQSVSNGTCLGITEVIDVRAFFNHCEHGKLTNGIPMIEYESSTNSRIMTYCYCYGWDLYSHRCSGYAAVEWYTAYLQSPFILFSYLFLLIMNLAFCVVPFAVKSYKHIRTDAYGKWHGVKTLQYQRLTMHVLTTTSVCTQILLAIFYFTFPYVPFEKYEVIVTIYDPLLTVHEACILCSLFFYLSLWVQILYQAKNLDAEQGAPWYLKLAPLPVCIIAVIATIAALSVSIVFSTKKNTKKVWKYALAVIDIIWLICMVVVWISLSIYGLLIYRLLSLMQKVSPLNLKFTRLLFILSIVGVLHVTFKSYLTYLKFANYVPFILPMRLKTTILSSILYAFTLVLMYAVFNWSDFTLCYPWAETLSTKLSTWWQSRKFKKESSIELRESFLRETADDTATSD